jgi:hypothetical protein
VTIQTFHIVIRAPVLLTTLLQLQDKVWYFCYAKQDISKQSIEETMKNDGSKLATCQKLDFRFATDEIDASDIEKMVKHIYIRTSLYMNM